MKHLNLFLKLTIISLVLFACRQRFGIIESEIIHKGEITISNHTDQKIKLPFYFSVPPDYNPGNSYPLVIALHGYGSSAEAFFPLWKEAADSLDFILLAPQGEDTAKGGIGFSWGKNSEQIVLTTLSILQEKIHIDLSRIYISGFSQGGIQACSIATKNSLLFRGFASICAPLSKDIFINSVPLNTNARAYISCGELEENIKTLSGEASKVLDKLGYKTRYIEYKNHEHSIPAPVNKEFEKILIYLDK